jgi:hypothetical protein
LKKIKSYPFYNTDNPLLSETDQLDTFKGKTFLEFNQIIGLPVKNDIAHPIYDYELDVIDKIESNRIFGLKRVEV